MLSPAYDLICTRLHVEDMYFALKGGFFSDDYEAESFRANGFYAYDDFYEFGLRIGLLPKRVIKMLGTFRLDYAAVHRLIEHSFLREDIKEAYRKYYLERLEMLNYSLAGRSEP